MSENQDADDKVMEQRDNISFLHTPHQALPIEEGIELFETSTIVVECQRPKNLAEFPDLTTRLRGALGRELVQAFCEDPHPDDPFNRLSPFKFLFGAHNGYTNRDAFPKPIAVRGEVKGERLFVRVHLLGHAQFYAPSVLEAMASVLISGISITTNARYKTPISVLDGWIEQNPSLPSQKGSHYKLMFYTPLCVRSGNNLTIMKSSFIRSVQNRVYGLFPWCGIEITNRPKLVHFKGMNLNTNAMLSTSWVRHSSRQVGKSIPMQGLIGTMEIKTNEDQLLPMLQIGEIFGLGSHATLGMGAFKLVVYP